MSADLKPRCAVVEWREEYNTGIDEVDSQHKHLFFLVKYLGLETIDETLNELADYVFAHFSAEQKLMEEGDYSELDHHREIHDGFVITVAECIASDHAWDDDRIHELREYLNAWLIEHIMVEDQNFGRWYKNYKQSLEDEKAKGQTVTPEGWFTRIFKRG